MICYPIHSSDFYCRLIRVLSLHIADTLLHSRTSKRTPKYLRPSAYTLLCSLPKYTRLTISSSIHSTSPANYPHSLPTLYSRHLMHTITSLYTCSMQSTVHSHCAVSPSNQLTVFFR